MNLPTEVATLTAQEEILLCRLSVFVNGWTLEAAQAVGACQDLEASKVLGLLTRLAAKSGRAWNGAWDRRVGRCRGWGRALFFQCRPN